MAWSDPTANLTFTTGEIVTSAKMNLIRDDLDDLNRRTTVTGAAVATLQTTTSTTYANLTTTGPAVTVTIGAVGLGTVDWGCLMSNTTSGQAVYMSYALSGATTRTAASTGDLFAYTSPSPSGGIAAGRSHYETGLNAGSTTFTAKYRVTANTGNFQDRELFVVPLGS